MEPVSHHIESIGVIRSCYRQKFGIPRQSGLVDSAEASLIFHPPYNRMEMLTGLMSFSHVWISFIFHQSIALGWKATVRPPRLGGRTKMGVLATRSPHRPNHLGLSVVRLKKIFDNEEGCGLLLSGVDLLDGTPVVDVKPYLPYCDRITDPTEGFTAVAFSSLQVSLTTEVEEFCRQYTLEEGRPLRQLITETIGRDPRPASQREDGRAFGILLYDVNIRWRVAGGVALVERCERVTG